MTVRKFINQSRQWQQARYIAEDVWTEVNALVSVESLPAQKTDPDNISSVVLLPNIICCNVTH